MKKLNQMHESLEAVHTHTHTQVILVDRKFDAIFAFCYGGRKTIYEDSS